MTTNPHVRISIASAVQVIRLAEAMTQRPTGDDMDLWGVLRRAAEICTRAADLIEADGRAALEADTPGGSR